MKDEIVKKALELGFDDCRITSAVPPERGARFQEWIASGQHGTMGYLERNAFKRVDPDEVLNGARSIITVATSYFDPGAKLDQSQVKNGIVARYARFTDYHDVLASRLKELSEFVQLTGGAGTRSLWYVDTGPLLERELAHRAGLGFVGKHTNLISRKLGNWFFISEIITTLDLLPDESEKNRCGTCARCIDSCPTGAITGPFELDARKCISYLTIELKGSIPEEYRARIGRRIYGCDICLEACPWNRFAREGRIMRDQRRDDLSQMDLIGLLGMDQVAFKQKFAGTPMLRTKRRGILRNVCVALGNCGDAQALAALEKAASDPEPLIAEHAHWAIGQIVARTRSTAP